MSILTIQQITNHSLRILEKELAHVYKPTYKMRFSYGKYSIYEYRYGGESKRLAKGLSKDEATGMLKLLESNDE